VVVLISAFIVITTLCTRLIRKNDILRFLFGMKTTHPFFNIFRKKSTLIILHALYVALIVVAAVNVGKTSAPMPLTYDPATDILLDAGSITVKSTTGVRVIIDEDYILAADGIAIKVLNSCAYRQCCKRQQQRERIQRH